MNFPEPSLPDSARKLSKIPELYSHSFILKYHTGNSNTRHETVTTSGWKREEQSRALDTVIKTWRGVMEKTVKLKKSNGDIKEKRRRRRETTTTKLGVKKKRDNNNNN